MHTLKYLLASPILQVRELSLGEVQRLSKVTIEGQVVRQGVTWALG
jgi:hypothetical protein